MFSQFYCEICRFLVLPCEMFCGIITDNEFNLIALKNIRKNVILFKLSWYKVFVHKNWNYSIP